MHTCTIADTALSVHHMAEVPLVCVCVSGLIVVQLYMLEGHSVFSLHVHTEHAL